MYMPRVLILVAHRKGRSPSQRYRFEQYLPFLEQNGYTFTWSPLLNETDDALFYSTGNFLRKVIIMLKGISIRFKDLRRIKDFDIVFIQREASFFGTSYFERKARSLGEKVIFDFDDAIWMADTSPGNKKWEWIKKPEKFKDNISSASVVIAGNSYLADEAKKFNSNVVIIPTTVDTQKHVSIPELRNKPYVTIGWSGSISTIKHFEQILPVLKQLKKKYAAALQLKLVGDPNYQCKELELQGIKWTDETEVELLNSFDIGIMPLPDDKWAKGKCGLKALTYMACGVATVASKVGVNTQIIEHGVNGFLVQTDNEWMEVLERLINDATLRKSIGDKGRTRVIEAYSVEANRQKYLEVFQSK